MRARIDLRDLYNLAAINNLEIQHECGGYRLVQTSHGGRRDVYPEGGVCRVVPARELWVFMQGMAYETRRWR